MSKLRIGKSLDKTVDVFGDEDEGKTNEILEAIKASNGKVFQFNPQSQQSSSQSISNSQAPTLITNISSASPLVTKLVYINEGEDNELNKNENEQQYSSLIPPTIIAFPFRLLSELFSLISSSSPSYSPFLSQSALESQSVSLWTENISLANEFVEKIKAKEVYVNCVPIVGEQVIDIGRNGGDSISSTISFGAHSNQLEKEAELYQPINIEQELKTFGSKSNADILPYQNDKLTGDEDENKGTSIDRTSKLFIGGKQARSDSEQVRVIYGKKKVIIKKKEKEEQKEYQLENIVVGQVYEGSKKDIRNAVESARTSGLQWASKTGFQRAQVLYYIGENLSARKEEFAKRIEQLTGSSAQQSLKEVELSIQQYFNAASLCCSGNSKGKVLESPISNMQITTRENPVGVI
ncbi:MAG: putative aldehyde dehydrogenase, partial [Streblomastix strix]